MRVPSRLWVNVFCSSPVPAPPIRPWPVSDALIMNLKLPGGLLLQPQHFQSGQGPGNAMEQLRRMWDWLCREAGVGWDEKLSEPCLDVRGPEVWSMGSKPVLSSAQLCSGASGNGRGAAHGAAQHSWAQLLMGTTAVWRGFWEELYFTRLQHECSSQ